MDSITDNILQKGRVHYSIKLIVFIIKKYI